MLPSSSAGSVLLIGGQLAFVGGQEWWRWLLASLAWVVGGALEIVALFFLTLLLEVM